MAASAWRVYTAAKVKLLTGSTIDLDAATIRMKVVASAGAAAVSNYTRSTFASCGTALSWKTSPYRSATTISVTAISANGTTVKWDFADVVFTASASTGGCRYLVLGVSNGPAIAWSKLSAATNVTTGNTLTVQINAGGVFTLSGGTT